MTKAGVPEKQAVTTEARLVALAGDINPQDGWHRQLILDDRRSQVIEAVSAANVATLAARMEQEKIGTVVRDEKGEVKELVFDGRSDNQHGGEIAVEVGATGIKTIVVRDAAEHPISIVYADLQSRQMQYDSYGTLSGFQDKSGHHYDKQLPEQSTQRNRFILMGRPEFLFGGRSGWDNISVEKNGDVALRLNGRSTEAADIEGRTIHDLHDGSSMIEYTASGSRLELHPPDPDGTVHGEATGSKPSDNYIYTRYGDGAIHIDYKDGKSGISIDNGGLITSWGPKTDDNFQLEKDGIGDPPKRLTKFGRVKDLAQEADYTAEKVLNFLNPFGDSANKVDLDISYNKQHQAIETYFDRVYPAISAAEQLSDHMKGKERERIHDAPKILDHRESFSPPY